MAPSVKCLPGVLAGGPELEIQNPHKKLGVSACTCHPCTEGSETGRAPEYVGWPRPSQPQVQGVYIFFYILFF